MATKNGRTHKYTKSVTKSPTARAAAFVRRHRLMLAASAGGLSLVLCVVALGFALRGQGEEAPAALSSEAASAAATASLPAAQTAGSVVTGAERPAPGALPKTPDAGLAYAQETLFLGDSNTERMLYYSDVTGVTVDNGFGVVSMGIGAFSTQGCARFEGVSGTLTMPEVVELLQPSRVVLTFGTNNVGMQVERFIDEYESALVAVREACPTADIIVGGIFPVDQYRQNTSITMKRISEMNEALGKMSKSEGVYFLNWGEAMLDEDIGHSRFEDTIQDGVHLSRTGMQAIFGYFRTHSLPRAAGAPAAPKTALRRIAMQPQSIQQDGRKQAGPVDWAKVEAEQGPVTVVFSAWDETNGTAGGGTVSPGSVSVKPGGSSGSVTASPAEGYVFVGWGFASGASGGGGASTAITVDAAVPPGSTLTVTAVFKKSQPLSSSSSLSSSLLPDPPSIPSSSLPPAPPPPPDPSSSSSSSSSSSQPVVPPTPSSSLQPSSSSQASSSSQQSSSETPVPETSSSSEPPSSSEGEVAAAEEGAA